VKGVIFLVVVAALFAGYGTAYLASDDVRYLTRAGIEETRILQARQPIAALAADPHTQPALRDALGLVVASRNYAAGLGLEAKETYTTYADVGRDTLLLVLQAAPRDCICPYTWKYPIVGRIPYKGFFDTKAAQREAARLGARGYDIHLRPSGAFSTLGWFNDPLLSTALTGDSVELAATVFHEIAHNTLYVKSATPFNESYAQFVGYHSAQAFFRERGDSVLAQRAADRWHDEIVLGEFYAGLVQRLQTLYDTHPDSTTLERGSAASNIHDRPAPRAAGQQCSADRGADLSHPARPVRPLVRTARPGRPAECLGDGQADAGSGRGQRVRAAGGGGGGQRRDGGRAGGRADGRAVASISVHPPESP
jgi:predicted aminopeptidase